MIWYVPNLVHWVTGRSSHTHICHIRTRPLCNQEDNAYGSALEYSLDIWSSTINKLTKNTEREKEREREILVENISYWPESVIYINIIIIFCILQNWYNELCIKINQVIYNQQIGFFFLRQRIDVRWHQLIYVIMT